MHLTANIVRNVLTAIVIINISLSLQGCPAVLIGAAGGTALAVHDRRDSATMLQDQRIESTATDKLYGDAQLKNKIHINVTSYNRVVLLSGEVLTHAARDQAVNIVQKIPGIRIIHNELVVADLTSFASRSKDSLITSKVKTEMLNEKDVDATRVKVVTENGNVFLMGLVTDKEAELAVKVARNVGDVKQVTRIFEIIPEPAPPPVVNNEKK